MSKQFWVALVVIAVILGGILYASNHHKNQPVSSTGKTTSHTMGSTKTGVTLVEYGDYECPVCGEFYPTVKQVSQTYSDRIIFQFRNLPLTQIHQNAFAAARAAEAAGLQGKYWEMHDALYESQNSWAQSSNPQSFFDSLAKQLGLNTQQFDDDYSSSKVNDAINADLAAFNNTGDELATPTFYLDGKKLNNASLLDANGQPSVTAFSKVIDAEIAKKAASTSTTKQ